MKDYHYVVGVGASEGGFSALSDFFGSINPHISASFVVVCKPPGDFATRLHVLLSTATRLRVEFLLTDTRPVAGHVYLVPARLQVTTSQETLRVREVAISESTNFAIDEFLFSLASDFRERAAAVILSGVGTDGSQGVKAVHDHRGVVLVQDPTSATDDAMPAAAIMTDHPWRIANPKELALQLSQLATVRGVDKKVV